MLIKQHVILSKHTYINVTTLARKSSAPAPTTLIVKLQNCSFFCFFSKINKQRHEEELSFCPIGPMIESSSQQAGQSTDLTRSTEEDSLVDGPLISADVLQSAIRREFQSVPTTCSSGVLSLMHVCNVLLLVFLFHLDYINCFTKPLLFVFLLSSSKVLYVVLSLCVGIMCVLKFGKEEVCLRILGSVKGDCAIVFGKVFLWVLTLLHSLWMQHHHSRARSRGYLRFYRQTRRLQQLPLITHSTGGPARCSLCHSTHIVSLKHHCIFIRTQK